MKCKISKNRICCLLAAVCITLCGCDNSEPPAEDTSDTAELIPVITETQEEPQPYPVIVNDTVIDKRPSKVVSMSPSLTEIICEMGHSETLVGRGSYCDYPESISSLPDAGRPAKPDIDAIKALSPDILLTATAIPVKDVYDLEESGIKTVYISYPRSVGEFENIYKAIGFMYEGLFDGEKKGEEAFAPVRSVLESGNVSLGKFVYVTEELSVAGNDTFEGAVLSCFGTNVGGEGKGYSFPKEYLLEMQPDVILLNSSYTAEDLASDEILSQLDAFTAGSIITIDNSYFERPSARISGLLNMLKQ